MLKNLAPVQKAVGPKALHGAAGQIGTANHVIVSQTQNSWPRQLGSPKSGFAGM
jgi:hypothetical protein